jgi:myo-inositol-1(or 4)-monophosphatase
MSKAAEKASHGIARDFGELERLQPSQRGIKSFADKSSDRAIETITKLLSRAYPNIPFMHEKSGDNHTEISNIVWGIDPINGMTNFMRGVPHFSINLSLLENMTASAGIILDPLRGEYYRCEVGGGAFVNNRNRLRVSNTKTINKALITTNLPLEDDISLVRNGAILRKTASVSLDMAYVAAGKYDACFAKGTHLSEVATGILLIREAGGFVRCEETMDGKYDVIAAASNEFMEKLLSLYNTM